MISPSLPIVIRTFVPILLIRILEEQMEYREETRDNHKKPPIKVRIFPDAQIAIDDLLDDWLPRLSKSNEILIAALLSIKGLCSVESSSGIAQRVLAEVDVALERDSRVKKGC
jgi:hypothetical protein